MQRPRDSRAFSVVNSVWSQVWGITEATGAGEQSWREKQQEEEGARARSYSALQDVAQT